MCYASVHTLTNRGESSRDATFTAYSSSHYHSTLVFLHFCIDLLFLFFFFELFLLIPSFLLFFFFFFFLVAQCPLVRICTVLRLGVPLASMAPGLATSLRRAVPAVAL